MNILLHYFELINKYQFGIDDFFHVSHSKTRLFENNSYIG